MSRKRRQRRNRGTRGSADEFQRLREIAAKMAADGPRWTIETEDQLQELLPTLPGRSIVAVRYGVLPSQETPSPDDFDTWVHDLRIAHLLDFGLELDLDDGRGLYATWTSPPHFYLQIAAGHLAQRGSEGTIPCQDVTSMKPWPELLNRTITRVELTRSRTDILGVRGKIPVLLDAEFHLEGDRSFFLSARRFDPRFDDEQVEPYTDTILVTFGRAAAAKLRVGPFANDQQAG